MESTRIRTEETESTAEGYSIKETAQQTRLSEDTIRYYEKIGLLPRARRKENRHRIYGEEEIRVMKLIGCLKKTGMPLDEMKPYLDMARTGDLSGTPENYERFRAYRQTVLEQIAELQSVVAFMDLKLEQGSLMQRRTCDEPESELGLPIQRSSKFQ
ncbi:MerR family transcriptional regulator [Saccharibacillus sp. CPCC 101409]|uniref:MerR family transcriptional regulator n=1 Tax=Saccharibacillus sp. CPCC 101409 TaxID=3058041 RepID=UPI002673954F|nr:MerR family transcriptional regulator [Saccharibacillus sp. CPCC 101409]MDO3411575.1 MerR family transcriptional regulator [Saccharibacillus sp. CPCC 101409]